MGGKYYAVVRGRKTGIFRSWKDCSESVMGYPNSSFKSFTGESAAQIYINDFKKCEERKGEMNRVGYLGRTISYTDGSKKKCGAGYGVVILDKGPSKELYGKVPIIDGKAPSSDVTELYAIAIAIDNTTGPLTIMSDSEYSVNTFNLWVKTWISNGWKNSQGKSLANRLIIEYILGKIKERDVTFEYVRGHDISILNKRADALANMGAEL